jgi:ketosteroid isomerase-like protein
LSDNKNKAVVRKAYEAMGESGAGFMDYLTDDVTWTFFGSHVFAGTLTSKREIRERLLAPMAQVVPSSMWTI